MENTKVKGLLLSVVTSLGNVLLPRMSYYVKNNMKDKFLIMMTKAINFTFLMALPFSIFFVLCAKESILLLAGSEYLGAVLGMQFLVIAVIPNALTGVLGMQVLIPLEKENFVLYSVIVGAILDFVLNIIFIMNEYLVLIYDSYKSLLFWADCSSRSHFSNSSRELFSRM